MPLTSRSARTLGSPLRLLLAVLLAAIVLALTAQAAAAKSPIEGVWSFNGGKVAIQAQPNGTFVGTVVQATTFAVCSHPIGEQMWTGITAQGDGSYWGFHQWYFETPECVANPTLGPTAWRVMDAGGGTHYLLACFSSPGAGQPTIASDGAQASVGYGCFQSARVAALSSESAVESFKRSVTLPSARKCLSHRVFKIHLQDPKYDPFKEVIVSIRGRKVKVARHGNVFAATINLKGLPRGTFTVKIRAVTVLGRVLPGSRTYHTCIRKAAAGGKSKHQGHA